MLMYTLSGFESVIRQMIVSEQESFKFLDIKCPEDYFKLLTDYGNYILDGKNAEVLQHKFFLGLTIKQLEDFAFFVILYRMLKNEVRIKELEEKLLEGIKLDIQIKNG